jgi:GWxTD domain-containing protein
MRLVRSVVVLALFAGAGMVPCMGQSASSPDTLQGRLEEEAARLLLEGVRRAKAGKYEASLARLRPLFERDTTSLRARQESLLAYWLGKVCAERGRTKRALDVWRTGVLETDRRPAAFSYRLADAFIRTAVHRGSAEDYERATDAYLRLLRQTDETPLTDGEQAIARQHLRELAVILPPQLQKRTGVRFDRDDFEITIDRTPGAGTVLAKWWKSRDPIPRTRQNERIREHLDRASYAREHFTHEGRMDDRGKLYIRLGEPHRARSIGMIDQETTRPITSRLRRNEFWTYPSVDPKAYYLLVEKAPDEFIVGGAADLFPTGLMPGREYLYLMEEVLRDLATFHGDYGTRAAEAFDRAAWSRDNEQYGIGSDPYEGPPEDFVRKMENKVETIDRQNAQRRAERVPSSYSDVAEEHPDLPIASRTARFLTETGKTTFQVYWSLPTSALALTENVRERLAASASAPVLPASGSPQRFALTASARQESYQYAEERVRNRQYFVSSSSTDGSTLEPRTLSVTVNDSLFHVATQWDQHAVHRSEGGGSQIGVVLRRHTERYDTLSALSSDPRSLEMSDLKLLTVPKETPATAVMSEAALPYPFDRVRVGQSLALAFEIYHLGRGDEDRTRYAVSYEMKRRTEDGGLLGLFGGDDERKTTTTTTYQGKSRTEKEYILLGLKNVIDDQSSDVTVTVTVRDKVTGQAVSRSTRFRVVVPDGK